MKVSLGREFGKGHEGSAKLGMERVSLGINGVVHKKKGRRAKIDVGYPMCPNKISKIQQRMMQEVR